MLELKKEEYRAKGEILLKDVIRGIKTEKKTEEKLAGKQSKLSSTVGEDNLTKIERLQRKKELLNDKIGIKDILKARRILAD
jgi:hypothetical protein